MRKTHVPGVSERDAGTNAIIRVSGLVGTVGMVTQDDFVLDWTNSFAFQNDDIPAGYIHRTGMSTRKEFTFVETPTPADQDLLMINDFADLVALNDAARRKACGISKNTKLSGCDMEHRSQLKAFSLHDNVLFPSLSRRFQLISDFIIQVERDRTTEGVRQVL